MAQRGRARGRAHVWSPGIATGGGSRAWLPASLSGFAWAVRENLHRWVLVEAAPGRLLPWLPIAYGTGITVYFTAPQEPLVLATIGLAVALMVAAFFARARPVAFPVALGLAAAAAGFATATTKTALIAHPVLQHPASNVAIVGWVEVAEERERTDRIVLRVHRIEARRMNEAPERVRLSVRKGMAPPVGGFVELKARLNPPLTPLRPGGYDFSRDLFFQRLGASGFVIGPIKAAEPPAAPGYWLRYATFLEDLRNIIDRRIRAAVPGDAGSIASMLLTGKQDAISKPVNDALYISSLAHVLSISGYHMAVVAGIVFFAVRGLLALFPGVALRYPIKKWAACVALAAATFYLLLSGAQVATQRSYYMIAVVLVGVLFDRAAITFRTLALAAIAVLLLAPEAVVHPSFQMSFAATLALVAGYQHGSPFKRAGTDTALGARVALWGAREVASLIFASLLAGLATTPYAAYHFHRLAPYGVLANLLAMPVVSAVVMPAGLVALVAMPFGFDRPLWQLMGWGIDWMNAVALWVADLPGAVGRITAFGTGPLLLCTLGLIVLCLLRTPLRAIGAILVFVAAVWALRTPQPDIVIAEAGDPIGVRNAAGQFSIVKKGGDAFAAKERLAADADVRVPGDPTLIEGVRCDEIGCIARHASGAIIALSLSVEAFADDCRQAAVVVTSRKPPPDCAAMVIDRALRARTGALALRLVGNAWEVTPARSAGYDRPWARAPPPSTDAATASPNPSSAAGKPPARDASPRAEDREAGD
jgi:competence protein ComEC